MTRHSGSLAVAAAAFAYFVAVTQRTSIGTASLAATERFHTNAEQLASLAVIQIVVYAAMQIPVGFLLDRFGARALLIAGALTMFGGQIAIAFASDMNQAVLARVAVGLGDSFTFISMIRVINGWYHGRQASQLQQWLANLGQLGQVASAIPFGALLGLVGWQSAFAGLAFASALAAVLVVVAMRGVRNSAELQTKPLDWLFIKQTTLENLRNPGIRFAFWVHFTTQSASTVFALLWGLPFLEKAEGLSHATASSLISIMVFVGIAAGLFYGWVCGKHPDWRFRLVIIVAFVIIAFWALVILWPTVAPEWLLTALVVALGATGPASMIAFDFSRQSVAIARLGSANGIVNIGGFLASFVTMFLIGVCLDFIHSTRLTHVFSSSSLQGLGDEIFNLDAFRLAMCVQIIVVAFGVWGLRVEHKKLQTPLANT